jgi:hypothetical protein
MDEPNSLMLSCYQQIKESITKFEEGCEFSCKFKSIRLYLHFIYEIHYRNIMMEEFGDGWSFVLHKGDIILYKPGEQETFQYFESTNQIFMQICDSRKVMDEDIDDIYQLLKKAQDIRSSFGDKLIDDYSRMTSSICGMIKKRDDRVKYVFNYWEKDTLHVEHSDRLFKLSPDKFQIIIMDDSKKCLYECAANDVHDDLLIVAPLIRNSNAMLKMWEK